VGNFRGILSSVRPDQVADVEQRSYARGLSPQGMGQIAMDSMQVIDRKYNELFSAFNMEKLREVLIACNQTENPGAELLEKVAQDTRPDRDNRALHAYIYIWEKLFLELQSRCALNRCIAEDIDADNLPDAVQQQLDRMVASVDEYEREQSAEARVKAVPVLSQSDIASFRAFVQGDAMGKAPASMIAIRKRVETDAAFAAFAEKELGISADLFAVVDKYNRTPSARLRAVEGKVTIGDESTGMVTVSKANLEIMLEAAAKARLI
jgi:hypothetical protein